jgi:hypothetical protein
VRYICGRKVEYGNANWIKISLLFPFLFDYALKRKSRAWMRDSENELDECDSGRAPANVDSRVTDAM